MKSFMNEKSFPNALTRTLNQPIDTSEVWDSIEEATEYVTNGTSYEGQIISVKQSDGTYIPYIVQNEQLLSLAPANDGTLTIVSNGSAVATFSANSATNVIATIDVPTVHTWATATVKPAYTLDEIDDTETYVRMTLAEKTTLGDLAAVATTGSYSDLSDKPNIPAPANDATISIQVGGVTQDSFTLNQSSNKNINLLVATADEIRELFNKYKEDNS